MQNVSKLCGIFLTLIGPFWQILVETVDDFYTVFVNKNTRILNVGYLYS